MSQAEGFTRKFLSVMWNRYETKKTKNKKREREKREKRLFVFDFVPVLILKLPYTAQLLINVTWWRMIECWPLEHKTHTSQHCSCRLCCLKTALGLRKADDKNRQGKKCRTSDHHKNSTNVTVVSIDKDELIWLSDEMKNLNPPAPHKHIIKNVRNQAKGTIQKKMDGWINHH